MSVIIPDSRDWPALQARLLAAQNDLAELTEDGDAPWFYERVFPVTVSLPLFSGTTSGGGYPAASNAVTVESGFTFFCLGVEFFYTASGVLSEDGVSPATLMIPETLRPQIMAFNYVVRDEGSDEDWSNAPVPSPSLRMGNLGRFKIGPHTQRRVRGGSRVIVTVNQTFFDSTSTATGLESFDSHNLQFVFSGMMLKDGVL